MKRFIFLFSAIFLFSCSGNDDSNDNPQTNSYFNPPEWIQGNWLDSDVGTGFRFTSDDFCFLQASGNNATCYKQTLVQLNTAGSMASVEEIVSPSEYKFTMILSGSSTTYHFYKVSANVIRWDAGLIDLEFTRQ